MPYEKGCKPAKVRGKVKINSKEGYDNYFCVGARAREYHTYENMQI